MLDEAFAAAVRDARWLLDREYPKSATITLVGDRYRLTGDQRHILYRGVFSDNESSRREMRLVRVPRNAGPLLIDGYNVVLVLLNYRRGTPVFYCDDGFVRDIGGIHGAIRAHRLFHESLVEMVRVVAEITDACASQNVQVAFDAPVGHSGRHAGWCRELLQEYRISGEVTVVESADYLLNRANTGTLATADTAILDKTELDVWDLAAYVLRVRYNARLDDLRVI